MKFVQKINGGALQLTIFIVVIIALLLSAFLVFIHVYKQFEIQSHWVLQTVENTNRGIEYALKNTIRLNDTVVIQDNKDTSIKVHRSLWGIFEQAISISTIKNREFRRVALVGAKQPEENRTALYLENNNKPLVVVGTTKIQGVSYLPKQGVRAGNISGEGYFGDRLLYGNRRLSGQLPSLTSEIQKEIKSFQQKPIHIESNQILDISEQRIFQNSFLDPVKVIYENGELILSHIKLSGHILVQSDTKIIVEADAKLTDVILAAPTIEVKNNVTGTFQAFATEHILVGNNSKLNYPSALILNEKEYEEKDSLNNEKPTYIKVEKETGIDGIVAYLGKYDPSNYQPQLVLEENSWVRGEIYCTENLELNGDVFGSVFTANFIVPRFGTIYQNHLYNSNILVGNLPKEYVGLLFKNSEKGVAKWLY